MRVLVVEDEERLAETIARGLRRQGFAADVVHDGASCLALVSVSHFDVVILDRNLPGVHGDRVCEELNLLEDRPAILMLTALSTKQDLVDGFHSGADDYLAKPFDFDELVVRVHALARRSTQLGPKVLLHEGLRVDPARHEVWRDDRRVELTAREMAVLAVLVKAQGAVVSAETLLERAWDENADPFTNSVRVLVSRLRTKLGKPDLIQTVTGKGYRI